MEAHAEHLRPASLHAMEGLHLMEAHAEHFRPGSLHSMEVLHLMEAHAAAASHPADEEEDDGSALGIAARLQEHILCQLYTLGQASPHASCSFNPVPSKRPLWHTSQIHSADD